MSRPSRPRSLLAGLLLLAGWQPACAEEDAWTRRADRETLDILHTLITEEVKARRVAFGRPVFDERFRTAAVFAQFETVTRHRDPDGPTKHPNGYLPNGIRKRDDLFATGIRYIYRKRGTAWVKIDDQVEFRAE